MVWVRQPLPEPVLDNTSPRIQQAGYCQSVAAPGSTVVSITPNAYDEPESVGSYATAIDYWPNGSIRQLDYGTQQGAGRTYTTTQNARQLPEKLKVVLGASTLADLTHSYDVNANITGITDAVNGSGFNRSMAYDDADRLTSASGFWGTGSYSFDALGNILTKTESGIDLDYTYSSTSNLLTSIDDSVGTADYSFTYDDYGNVTNNGSQGFTYNLAGNLTSSTSPALSYKYDGHKRRVQKTEAGQTSYTVYGANGKLLHKLKGGVATHYVYAGSLLIAELNGTTVNYLHTDLLGSPIKGDNGSSYAEHCRPWGEKKDHPTQLADDVGYTGHQNDIATGLTYMQARYYDPVVGRFMAVDPVQFGGTRPGSFNRYKYAHNNPYRYSDPDGRQEAPVVANLIDGGERRDDETGLGHFGAPRGEGRPHGGFDIVAAPGTPVTAPISGVVRVITAVYQNDDPDFDGVEITNVEDDTSVSLFYVDPSVDDGDEVDVGQVVGVAQDRAAATEGMINHVHLEVEVDGNPVDPEPLVTDRED